MKKIVFILVFLVSCITAFSQSEVIRYEQYGYLSQYAHLYKPAGWDSYQKKAAIIYLHGAGQRGNGTDTSDLDGEGPPRYIRQGANPACIVISPQLNNISFWNASAIAAAIDHVIDDYDVDPDQVYLDGYSLGATGVLLYLKAAGYRIAAAHVLAGDYIGAEGLSRAQVDSVAQVPIKLSHSGGDGTQNISIANRLLDSLLNDNHTLQSLPTTNYFFGTSHGSSDEATYADYESGVSRWLLLHHRNMDSTAEFHLDSLERAGEDAPWNLYTRSEYIVNNLSSSDHKTALLARLVTVKDLMNGGADYRRVILDLGVAAKTSTLTGVNNMTNGNSGQVLSNMVDEDGSATTWDFNVVSRTNTTEEENVGEPRGYWIWNEPNAFDDVFSVFSINSGSWRIEGLNSSKTYTIRMTGGGAAYSSGTQYGLDVTINGVTKSISLMYRNTDRYIEFKGIAPTSGNITISPDGITTNAVAGIGIIEIIEEGTVGAVIGVTAPADITYAYDQDDNTADFDLTAVVTNGTATTIEWETVSGPTSPTLINADELTVTVSGVTKGVYVFRVTIDGTTSDDVQVYIRDYNEAGKTSCREGGGLTFEIGNTILSGRVSTNWISIPYVNRDNVFGQQVLGNDTIRVHMNPNNGNVWDQLTMGGFGGADGCPVVVMPYDTNVVRYGRTGQQGYWRLASASSADTNFIYNVKIDGMAHRQGNRYVYGFQFYSADTTGLPIVAHNFRHLEICGVYSFGGTWLLKKDSDSSKVWSIYNNYNPGPLYIHDVYATATKEGEIFYIGHTYPNGALTGNDGPTIKGADGSRFRRIIITEAGWDGLQISHYGRNVDVSHVMTYKTGTDNQSSQQASIFIGGYTQGTIDSCVSVNGTGGMSVLGADTCYFRYNIVDSIKNGGSNDYDNVYISQTVVSEPPPLPLPLVVYSEYNLLNRMEQTAINHADANNRMGAGAIRFNKAGHPSASASTLFATNAGDERSDNTVVTSMDIDSEPLARTLPAWSVYKLVSADQVTKYSFFDVELAPKYRAPKQIGKRLIFNPKHF